MHKRKPLLTVTIACLLAGVLAISGCSINPNAGSSAPSPAPNNSAAPAPAATAAVSNATVNMAINAEPNFNPWFPTGFAESQPVTEILFDGLTKWGTDYQPVPALATDWKPADDGMSWTFNLKKDVNWSDGKPFTADDVVYTFNEIVLKKELGASNSSNFVDVDKVVAVSPTQVQFVLKKPWSSLPNYLAWYAKILPKHIFEGQDPWKLTTFNKEKPVGTGPFILTKYSAGQFVELERNPNYYGGGAKFSKIVFNIIPDNNTQIAQLLSGTLSMINVQDPNLLEKLKSNPNLNVNEVLDNNYFWIALDQSQERFRDVKVRQALLYAIDRESIIKGVLKGYGSVATGPLAPIQEKYYNKNVKNYAFDPEKAKSLLKEAGYTPGADGFMQKNGQVLEVNMPAGQYGVLVQASQLVQQYWQKVGVKVNLQVIDWNTYVQKVVGNRQYDATLCWWRAPVDPDVLAYYHSSSAGKGNNIPGYKNAALDKLLEDGRKAKTTEERVKIYNDVQTLTAEELPYLYLWYPTMAVATQKSLTVPKTTFIVAEDHITEWTIQK
ncbi:MULTISPECIES: ABC transporter substrate-binding protein [Paenibacillus]|uniref:ABC transporter substrate-binding protein n=1 Tax=Paenibacillus radicis (ex Xue et al. 2023) TaxID=2972489 RepID=A0ABT1Y9W0_9BACL|nr:ABC transporter substrate-binding protein [Paenibacillus radicis (ex Xue et al. 2023)]MCR8629962.1 ABC transporter substrate-binding protein [Paenibacillus radicis (ex Xue et al. 2023)]